MKGSKGNNGIISVELNSTKDIEGKNKNYNVVVTVFSARDNYVNNLINKDGTIVKYTTEDLLQVNPQLYNRLATINNKSSVDNSISQNNTAVNSNNMQNSAENIQKNDEKVRFSISNNFSKDFNDWIARGKPDREILTVGKTSAALKSIGVKNQTITWDTSKINKSLKKHFNIDENVIKQIPNVLEYPILVMQSKQSDSRITLLGEVYDKNGIPVIGVLELMPTNHSKTVVLDEIKVTSTYSKIKKNNITSITPTQNFINSSDILYVEPNKKRTDNWLIANRLQLPLAITNYGSKKNITYPRGNVNGNNIQNSVENIQQNNENDIRFAMKEQITADDVAAVQSVGRKSINDFTSRDIQKTESFARKYNREMGAKSPFFRAWFGDWRAADTTPVHIVTEKGNVRGVTKNNDTGWDINTYPVKCLMKLSHIIVLTQEMQYHILTI